MSIKLNKILLLICVFIKMTEQSENIPCSVIKENDQQCGAYCYTIVKPLLQYTASVRSKEQQYIELESKMHVLESTVNHLEEIIENKEVQLATQIELAQVYKEKNIMNEELIQERNEQISKLEKQLLQIQNTRSEAIAKEINRENAKVINSNSHVASAINIPFKTEEVFPSPIKLNANQNSVLITPIQRFEPDKPIEIVKLEQSGNILHKYSGVNCIGKSTDSYMFKLPGLDKFVIPCDSKLVGSGWTVIQRRQDGSENFNRNWTEYRAGFGDFHREFFIGLEMLHLMTNAQPHNLYIYLEDFNNDIRHAHYKNFAIGNEKESYAIKTLGEYSGNAEDALLNHKNSKFSTPDHYFDMGLNCAENYNSGWWFNDGCYLCNLNAPYVSGTADNSNGIEWRTWHFKPLKFVQMMIKPNNIK